jgi:hypothetical protein
MNCQVYLIKKNQERERKMCISYMNCINIFKSLTAIITMHLNNKNTLIINYKLLSCLYEVFCDVDMYVV